MPCGIWERTAEGFCRVFIFGSASAVAIGMGILAILIVRHMPADASG